MDALGRALESGVEEGGDGESSAYCARPGMSNDQDEGWEASR